MFQFHRLLPKLWDGLPAPARTALSGNPVHGFLQRQVAYREELAHLEISPTPEFSFEMPVPERLGPWWLDYDRSEPHSCHEPITTRTFIDEIERGDVVWDMGSQWGYFSVLAAALNEEPRNVHVFDMEPFHCLQIRRTSDVLYGGDGLNVVETRIGDEDGPASTSGDGYADRTTAPDVVKIDIEGAEVLAVDGMVGTITSHRPTMIIEVHPNKIERHFESKETDMLALIDDEYDDIAYCTEFRRQDSTWMEFSGAERPVDRSAGMDGRVDLDSYQLLCRP